LLSIPIIDISGFPGDRGFVEALGRGYEAYGFCGIVGHGIDAEVIAAAYAAVREFFALPDDIKRRYETGLGGARGYTRFGVETAKDNQYPDLKEFWQVGRELPVGHRLHSALYNNVWPAEVRDFRTRLYGLFEALEALGRRILQALALYLQLPADYFEDKVNLGNSILRPLHYPPIAELQTPSLRSAAHEDINLITLLVGSEEPGLEVLSKGGDWIPVATQPGTIVVNIGDMMQRLTNHVLPSTTHRVVNTPQAYDGQSRYSIPFFFHPNPDFLIASLPSCVTADNPDRYPTPILADDYLTQRLIEIGLLAPADTQLGDSDQP